MEEIIHTKIVLLCFVLFLAASIMLVPYKDLNANTVMPKVELNSDFFDGVDEIIIWPQQTHLFRNGEDIFDRFPLSLIEEKGQKILKNNLSDEKKKIFKVVKLSDTDIRPYLLLDETKILLKCIVSYKKQKNNDKEYIIGAVRLYLWRTPPRDLNETTRVSGFHKHMTSVSSPYLFMADNLDSYESELDNALTVLFEDMANNINRY